MPRWLGLAVSAVLALSAPVATSAQPAPAASLNAAARQEVDYAWRQAGLDQQVDRARRDDRRQAGWLQDDRVARDDGCGRT